MIDMFNLGLSMVVDDKLRQRMQQLEALHKRAEELLAEIKLVTGRMVTATSSVSGVANGSVGTSSELKNKLSFYHVDVPAARRPH